jgi:hypothetical protein
MDLTRYLLFTGLVKHGELLRYLLAAQVRKRLMEQYQFRRQMKSSALTGNPDNVFELYYVEDLDDEELNESLNQLRKDRSFAASQQVTREASITRGERFYELEIPAPLQTLSEMPYLHRGMSQETCSQKVAESPYLLQVTCTLYDESRVKDFNKAMFTLLKEFDKAGLSLLAAGRLMGTLELPLENGAAPISRNPYKDENKPVRILNIWQFENPESPKRLMARLAESQPYSEIDEICDQEQHICRNISRHYQLYPLLRGPPLSIT